MSETAKKPEAGSITSEDKEKGILYVVHPVTKEQKIKLARKGKIVDAKYTPEKK
jgi:hypothetical protein